MGERTSRELAGQRVQESEWLGTSGKLFSRKSQCSVPWVGNKSRTCKLYL